MRLYETPQEQDLKVVTYFINEKNHQWPTNEDDLPIDPATKKPFLMEDGLPVAEEGEIPQYIRFWLRPLIARDQNRINAAIVKTRTQTQTRRRRRGNTANIEMDIDTGLADTLRLQAAIVKWEGIEDANGNPTEVSEQTLELLPIWLQADLLDVVTDMSGMSDEESEE